MRALRPTGQKMLGVLVGNKCELRDGTTESRAEVTKDEAAHAASELGLAYFETSAVKIKV